MGALNAALRVFGADEFPASAARYLAERLRPARSAVITGGGTARRVYEELAKFEGVPNLEIAFSDERAVPPDHPDSNYGMARRTLLDPLGLTNVHRMRGEDDPEQVAEAYEADIRDLIEPGPGVILLGLGDDAHIAGLFPGAPAISESERLCVAVDRPDGMRGISLTGPALVSARETVVMAGGAAKAAAVKRALEGNEPPEVCPARLLDGAGGLSFLVDEAAAARLS